MNCGTRNADDAAFCTKCGASLTPTVASSIERQAKMFAQNMEQLGKNLGESMKDATKRLQDRSQHMGKRIEQRVDQATHTVESWYDTTFGIVGPLIESFLFLIILRFAILLVHISASSLHNIDVITSVLQLYLLPLFGAILLANYATYFAKKSDKFRIFSPLLHAIVFTIILWIIARLLYAISERLAIAALSTAAITIEHMLPALFVLILLIGYVVLALNMSREQGQKH
jgi:uncharacterized membrane protein